MSMINKHNGCISRWPGLAASLASNSSVYASPVQGGLPTDPFTTFELQNLCYDVPELLHQIRRFPVLEALRL